MTTTLQKSPKQVAVDLYERLDLSTSNVDRANCIIKNVKILGKSSPNKHGLDVEGTDYLPHAHAQARALYEGIQVNVGHPPRSDPDAERNPNDRNGVLRNIKTLHGETFGDWKLIPSHPMTARFLDCAADPDLHNQFALSHNAKGYGQIREGRYQISEIPKVRSVDVVCNGGTNASLFEGRETMNKKKFKDILEAALDTTKTRFKPLLELYEDLGDMPVDPIPAPPADMPAEEKPAADYMTHLGEMVKAICGDEGLSIDEKRDKIMAAIKVMEETKEKPAEGAADLPEGDEGDDADDKDKDKKDGDKMESKEKEELLQLRGEKKVRDLCESLQFTPTALQIKALIPLTDADRKAMVAELKTLKPQAKTNTTPRTARGKGADLQESRAKGARDMDFSDGSKEALAKRAAYYRN